MNEKGCLSSCSQALLSPTHGPHTSHSRTTMSPVIHRTVAKSKSLTTSMDKLAAGTPLPCPQNRRKFFSRESSLTGCKDSGLSCAKPVTVTRPYSRRSVHILQTPETPDNALQDASTETEECVRKSHSPTGSVNSLHSSRSANSSTHSVCSSHSTDNISVKSQASALSCTADEKISEHEKVPRASSEPPIVKARSVSPRKMLSNRTGFPKPELTTLALTHKKVISDSKRRSPSHGTLRKEFSSVSSLNSSAGDVRLDETINSKSMSRKSTPSRQTRPSIPNSSQYRHSIGAVPKENALPVFNSYMSLFQVQEKLKRGEVIEGVLRINPKSYEDAYISAPDEGMDIFIGGVRSRNTALHGDVVAVLLNPQDEWKVFYSQLDAFLGKNLDVKKLVYMPLTETSKYDIDNSSTSQRNTKTACATNKSTHLVNKETDKNVLRRRSETNDVKEKRFNSEKEFETVKTNTKKRGKRRRGKKSKDKKVEENKVVQVDELVQEENRVEQVSQILDIADESHVLSISVEVVPEDDIVNIISCPCPDEVVERKSGETEKRVDNQRAVRDVIVVPPDELSECDLTDDNESVSSLTLEIEDKMHLQNVGASCIENEGILSEGLKGESEFSLDGNAVNLRIDEQPAAALEVPVNEIISAFQYESGEQKKYKEGESTQTSTRSEHKKTPSQPTTNRSNNPKMETNRPTVLQIIQNMPNDWHKFIQKTAVVVHVFERKHSRLAAGILKPFADKNPHMALFSPFDCRIPRMKILTQSCPPDFLASPKSYSKIILLAKITEWNDPKFAFGELVRNIGAMGNIEAEIEAMLLENEIDYEEFPDDVVQTLPPDSWTIPAEELRRRTDLRQSTIFTIDPVTARDLDDAVSCLELPNGNLRVGVHIADVTYFLKVNSQLDAVAAERATSVYLPQTVIPMLPRALAENFCSLNPGADRLAFSVIWELTKEGKVEGEWFGRTVIRSCAKLSYDHAQQMIETSDLNSLTADDFPKTSDGHTLDEIAAIVQKLHGIAVHLRKKRIQMGALRLDQPRIGFSFDADSNSPNSFYIQEIRDSNRLIEEFMLLANIAVATKIWSTFPKLAVLRRHPRPHAIQLENYIKFFAQNEIYLDASSSRSLNHSIENYRGSDPLSIAKMNFIVNICSKPMKFAKYFCAATATKEEEFHHYALNVSRYTHFTSPIRRYADIMVHRLLAAAINSDLYSLPPWKESTIVKKVDRCNTQRRNAKLVQETSTDLYLALFVRNIGQLIEQGMIIGVLDRAVDVLMTRIGITKRCYLEKLPLTSFQYTETDRIGSLVLEWEEDKSTNLPPLTQKLTFFDRVTVALRPFDNEALKINAFIMRPDIPVPL